MLQSADPNPFQGTADSTKSILETLKDIFGTIFIIIKRIFQNLILIIQTAFWFDPADSLSWDYRIRGHLP